MAQQIRGLRESSRRLVRVLGVINNRIDEIDCSPAQCHSLIEVSNHGQLTTKQVAALLEVDKSTASRTLRALVGEGLLQAGSGTGDERTKPVRLSDKGRTRVEAIHAAADSQVRDALELLTEEEREIVLRGVSLYEQALHRSKALASIVVRPIEAGDEPAMANVIRNVMTEFGAVGSGYSIEDMEVDTMHGSYTEERFAYFVAEQDGQIMAGAGIAPLVGSERDDVCELRKMYALSSVRGFGVGRRLLDHCLTAARDAGFRICYLETLEHMDRARALYEKAGFEVIDAPMGNTGHQACDQWLALDLKPKPQA
ncbi:MAG: putative acetyltransferase [Planctomycetota bacterium]|jgi:putative acetyltransferase